MKDSRPEGRHHRRRPDVRRSERALAAQTARIGVATADLYPSFSLTGFMTLQAPEFGGHHAQEIADLSLVETAAAGAECGIGDRRR